MGRGNPNPGNAVRASSPAGMGPCQVCGTTRQTSEVKFHQYSDDRFAADEKHAREHVQDLDAQQLLGVHGKIPAAGAVGHPFGSRYTGTRKLSGALD